MQNARDTFYVTLRDRVAAVNPGRTLVVRGTVRPAVVVMENELVSVGVDGIAFPDTFCLRWAALTVDTTAALPLVTMSCEVKYATDGTQAAAGMDRGRALAEMDAELVSALVTEPRQVTKMAYDAGAAARMATSVFWGDPVFGAAVVNGERLERTAVVEVLSYQEAGEL